MKSSSLSSSSSSLPSSSSSSSSSSSLRRFAFFMDGMTRATIYSFGPILMYRFLLESTSSTTTTSNSNSNSNNNHMDNDNTMTTTKTGTIEDTNNNIVLEVSIWSMVSYSLAYVVAVFIVGKSLGTWVARQWFVSYDDDDDDGMVSSSSSSSYNNNNNNNNNNKSNTNRTKIVARLGGLACAVYVITVVGCTSMKWLGILRFVAAMVTGILCAITTISNSSRKTTGTNSASLTTSTTSSASVAAETVLQPWRKDEYPYVDMTAGTTRMYLSGFAVSILIGQLLYRFTTEKEKDDSSAFGALQALSAYQYILSPLFLLAITFGVEVILLCIFNLFTTQTRTKPTQLQQTQQKQQTKMQQAQRQPPTPPPPPPVFEFEGPDGNKFDPLMTSTPSSSSKATIAINSINDEFFDCQSNLSSDTDIELQQDQDTKDQEEEEDEQDHSHSVCLYKNRKCVYKNGSPSYVPPGDSIASVPPNYVKVFGNIAKAQTMWESTQKVRREKDIWKIHSQPNKWYYVFKKAYPHTIHGHNKVGNPVIYERPGKMNLKNIFRDGCDVDHMIQHLYFHTEFICNNLCTKPSLRALNEPDRPKSGSASCKIMVVMDVDGIAIAQASPDAVRYVSRAGDVNNHHYPGVFAQACVVNTPFWLAGFYGTIKGYLPKGIDIEVCSRSKHLPTLRQYIDDDQIPPEYGGSSPYSLGFHPYEVELRDCVEEAAATTPQMPPEKTPVQQLDQQPIPTMTIPKDSNLEQETPPRKTRQCNFQNDVDIESQPLNLDNNKPLRNRRYSYVEEDADKHQQQSSLSSVEFSTDRYSVTKQQQKQQQQQQQPVGGETTAGILCFISTLYGLWNIVQGMTEMIIPLWILSPYSYGGLGYTPEFSAIALFCSILILMWVIRTPPVSRSISIIPSEAPLRAFRIGVGTQSALFVLLVLVAKLINDSVVVMASTIILISCMILAGMLGRSAGVVLQRTASENFVRSTSLSSSSSHESHLVNRVVFNLCQSGQLTSLLTVGGELCGVLLIAPLWSWSIMVERQVPLFSGPRFCLLLSSALLFVLYVCSCSLYMNTNKHNNDNDNSDLVSRTGGGGGGGGSSSISRRRYNHHNHYHHHNTTTRRRLCCSFFTEMITVSAGDVVSLLEPLANHYHHHPNTTN